MSNFHEVVGRGKWVMKTGRVRCSTRFFIIAWDVIVKAQDRVSAISDNIFEQ